MEHDHKYLATLSILMGFLTLSLSLYSYLYTQQHLEENQSMLASVTESTTPQ